jgi:hypothetical protein
MEQASVASNFFSQFSFLSNNVSFTVVAKEKERKKKTKNEICLLFTLHEVVGAKFLDLCIVNSTFVYRFRINQNAESGERRMFISDQIQIQKKHQFIV